LTTGFVLSITKSTGNDYNYFGKKKIHILSNCVIEYSVIGFFFLSNDILTVLISYLFLNNF